MPAVKELRRPLGTPSPSKGAAPGPSRIVPSSTRVNSSEPHPVADHVREQRSALQHVLGVERAREHAQEVHRRDRVEHDRYLRRGRLGRAQHAHRPLDRLVGDLVAAKLVERSRDAVAETRLDVSSPSTASVTATTHASVRAYSAATRSSRRPRHATPRRRAEPGRPSSREDRSSRGAARGRAPSAPCRRSHVGGVLAEQLGDRRDDLAGRQQVELVGLGERGVLPSARDRRAHLVDRRVGGVRIAPAARRGSAAPPRPGIRRTEPLDLPARRARLRLPRLLGIGLDALVGLGGLHRRPYEVAEIRHRCPPR